MRSEKEIRKVLANTTKFIDKNIDKRSIAGGTIVFNQGGEAALRWVLDVRD